MTASSTPISLHPENPHYFLWKSEPAILITSGEHYGALLNLDFDFDTYFQTLQRDGLNHTRIFSGTYREASSSFGIMDNPLAPKPNRYASPWKRSSTLGYFDGGNKFNLTQWDESYFQRAKAMMISAQRNGIVVEFNLFCPLYKDVLWEASPMNSRNNINGIGSCLRTEVLALKNDDLTQIQLAFVRKIVKELNSFDNLYYEVCNEPYFHGVTMKWQHRIADEIIATESRLPKKHLVSMNIANGAKKVENSHPGISIFNFHYCVPPTAVGMNYHLNKVIGENETGFRGKDDLLYRTECWDFLIAGGALYNNLDYSFTPKHPDGTLSDYSSPGGGSPALRKQLSICKKFFDDMNVIHMKPDNSVIVSVSDKLTASALVEPGKTYAIYMHVSLPKKPKNINDHKQTLETAKLTLNLPKGSYKATWTNTKSGKVIQTTKVSHSGGEVQLNAPAFSDDVAVKITAR